VREQMLEKDQTLKRLTSQVQISETNLKTGTYPNSGRALTDKARKALEKSLQSNAPKINALQQRVGALNKKLAECEREASERREQAAKMADEIFVQGPQMAETWSDAMHVRQLLLRAQLSSAATDNQKMWAGYFCVCLSLFFLVCVYTSHYFNYVYYWIRVRVRARVRACRALLSDFKEDKYKEKTTRMKEQGTYHEESDDSEQGTYLEESDDSDGYM